MTSYIEIPDADIEPDQPIKSSTAFALRDNLLAVIEGDATAPKITSRTISPGGSQADGDCTNATSFTGPGFFDFETLLLTAAKTLPFASFLRIDGDATISDVLTVRRTFASSAAEAGILSAIGGAAAESSADRSGSSEGSGGGGGVVGTGGNSSNSGSGISPGGAGLVTSASTIARLWAARRALVGGNSGTAVATSGVAGGGFLFLVVNGDLDLTGGTIDASGADGNSGGGEASGGGGGGCIIVVCTGTITGGTYDVSGGNGENDTGDGGGGGGGLVLLVATVFAGTRTKTVTGGNGPGTATDGAAGLAVESVLTAGEINALLLGAQ